MSLQIRLAAMAGLLAWIGVGLAGCAGPPPTAQQIDEENHTSQVAQIMRVAETTRRGGDLVSAAGLYRRAHTLAPKLGAPLIGLGDTLVMLGALPDAVQAYALAIEREPTDPGLRYNHGRALVALKRPRDAIEQFRTAIGLDPNDGRAFNGLGVALDQAGDHDSARQAYLDGLRIAPDHFGLKNNLAFSMLLAGEFADAVSRFEEVAGHPQATARTRQNLALAYGLAGDMANAKAVATQDLGEAELRNNLAAYDRLRGLTAAQRNEELLRMRDSGPSTAP